MSAAPVPIDPGVVAALRSAGCVFAEEEAQLICDAAAPGAGREALVARRAAGQPLEHLLGWVQFCGRRVLVGPGVFVPRRRTELLVRAAARVAPSRALVVELCCGVGAVAAALQQQIDLAELHVSDIDPAATAWAARNVPGAQVYTGDLFAPLPTRLHGRVDVLCVNAPYVPSDEIELMASEARVHEPRVALDGGPDGLELHRRVAAEAPRWLAPGGHVLIETSARQAEGTVAAVEAAGMLGTVVTDEDLGATVVVGRLARGPSGAGGLHQDVTGAGAATHPDRLGLARGGRGGRQRGGGPTRARADVELGEDT